MPFDGSGNFDRVHNFSADASAGIQAQAVRFDAELDGIATGLENCQTLTGETTPTADSPMGGFKHKAVAVATSTDNYLRADQSSNQVGIYVRDKNTGVTGTITASAAVFPTVFTDGQRVTVKVSADGSAVAPRAIIINGLSANILDNRGSALPASKMLKDGIFELVYDISASAFRSITPRNDINLADESSVAANTSSVTLLLTRIDAEEKKVKAVFKAVSELRAGHSASTSALSADASMVISMSVGATYQITGQIRVVYASANSAAGIQFRFAQDGDGVNGFFASQGIPFGVTASTSAGDLIRLESHAWGDTLTLGMNAEQGDTINIHGIWPASASGANSTLTFHWDPLTSADASVGVAQYSHLKAEKIS